MRHEGTFRKIFIGKLPSALKCFPQYSVSSISFNNQTTTFYNKISEYYSEKYKRTTDLALLPLLQPHQWSHWGVLLWPIKRKGKNIDLVFRSSNVTSTGEWLLVSGPLRGWKTMTLKDGDGGKFSLWAALQSVHPIVHFLWKEMVKRIDLHSFMESG